MISYDTLSEATNDLKKRGYSEDFNLTPTCLHCTTLDLQIHPEHFEIKEFYRFEGNSNPSDSSIVYAIESTNGIKGVLVDDYGAYSESVSSEMASKLRMPIQ